MKINKLLLGISIFLVLSSLIIWKNKEEYFLLLNHEVSITIKEQTFTKVRVFNTPELSKKGLSGVKPNEFGSNEIALFVYPEEQSNRFWMPNTHFPLTIIFIDSHGLVVGKESIQNFPHEPTKENDHLIPRTGNYTSKFVIEIKDNSPIKELIELGEYLDITFN